MGRAIQWTAEPYFHGVPVNTFSSVLLCLQVIDSVGARGQNKAVVTLNVIQQELNVDLNRAEYPQYFPVCDLVLYRVWKKRN